MRLVHYSASPVTAIRSVQQLRVALSFKPRGLWVSDDDCANNWRAWCEEENFRLLGLACAHDVTLAPDASILLLEGAADIDAFTRQYGATYDFTPPSLANGCPIVRWGAVAAAYDGIVITPYVWERRLDGIARWYYAWDCASGCIWNARAIASIALRQPAEAQP